MRSLSLITLILLTCCIHSLVPTSACTLLKKIFTIIAGSGGGGVAEFVTITGRVPLRERQRVTRGLPYIVKVKVYSLGYIIR